MILSTDILVAEENVQKVHGRVLMKGVLVASGAPCSPTTQAGR